MKFKDLVYFLCLVISLIIVWQFRQILLLIFTAVVLAIILNSLVRRIVGKFGVPRLAAVFMVLGLVLLGGTLLMVLVVPLFVDQFGQLLQQVPESFEQFGIWINAIIEALPGWLPKQELETLDLSGQIQRVITLSLAFFSNSFAILLNLVLVIVLTVMILANPLAYRRLGLRLFPSVYRRRADDIFSKCEIALLGWVRGITFNSLFVASCCGFGLLGLKVEFTFTHAMLAGIFNFVPNIGPLLSVVFPLSVALLDSAGKTIAVIVLYLIVQNVESYWFSPVVMQQQVSFLPAATLIAQIFFATFFGPLGLIMALPLAAIAKTWLEEAWIKDVLDEPSTAPRIQPKQRYEGYK